MRIIGCDLNGLESSERFVVSSLSLIYFVTVPVTILLKDVINFIAYIRTRYYKIGLEIGGFVGVIHHTV